MITALRRAALLACLLAPAPAFANRVWFDNGIWSVNEGARVNGQRFCSIATSVGRDANFFVKALAGRGIEVRLASDGWRIPPGTRVPVRIRIDNNPVWFGNGTGNGMVLDVPISSSAPAGGASEAARFIAEFAAGLHMVVDFPEGSARGWSLSLRGTSAATNAMLRCMREMNSGGGQPFGAQPQPRGDGQPFAPARQAPSPAPGRAI